MIEQLVFKSIAERNRMDKTLRAQGIETRRWTESGQEVGYSGFGSDRDSMRRSVYILDVRRQ